MLNQKKSISIVYCQKILVVHTAIDFRFPPGVIDMSCNDTFLLLREGILSVFNRISKNVMIAQFSKYCGYITYYPLRSLPFHLSVSLLLRRIRIEDLLD